MKRREGMFARERLATLVDLMVDARQRSVVQPNLDEQGAGSGGEVGVRMGAGKDGNEAVLRVLKGVLEGLGVDLEEGEGVWDIEGEGEARRMDVGRASSAVEGGDEGGSGGRGRFGWPELQLRAMRDAIGIAEVLPGSVSTLLLPSSFVLPSIWNKSDEIPVALQTTPPSSSSPSQPFEPFIRSSSQENKLISLPSSLVHSLRLGGEENLLEKGS